MGSPQLIMAKLWQMMQSRDTKLLNLYKDFEDVMSKVKQIGWNESHADVRLGQRMAIQGTPV